MNVVFRIVEIFGKDSVFWGSPAAIFYVTQKSRKTQKFYSLRAFFYFTQIPQISQI